MKEATWQVYVLECDDGSLYCGISTDVGRRIQQHQEGTGARYTRGRGPVTLRAQWRCESRSEALKAEAAFKRLSKNAKWKRVRAD